ncbi:MAG: plastocyanin/azurin family copper-binding protein [Ilumatobacteraceae bacterium]
MNRLRGTVAVVAFVVLTIGGCGDDANDRANDRANDGALRETGRLTPIGSVPSARVVEANATTAVEVMPTGVVVPVVALDNIFRPDAVVVQVGDEVTWENRGQNDHNVLAVVGDDWGVQVDDFVPGASYSHVFTVPGEYAFYCSIHGTTTFGMVGTVMVED